MPIKDITGQKFNRLTVIKPNGKYRRGIKWLCKCDCGNEVTVLSYHHLRSGNTKSCGCLSKQRLHEGRYKHGDINSPEYVAWKHLKQRCYNPNDRGYKDYGGRGITICDRWLESYTNFISDMGRKPSDKHSIERKDNNKNYSPDNCIWATRKVQARNTRQTRMVTFKGKTQCIMDWSHDTGIGYQTIRCRLNAGWTPEKTLTTIPRPPAKTTLLT